MIKIEAQTLQKWALPTPGRRELEWYPALKNLAGMVPRNLQRLPARVSGCPPAGNPYPKMRIGVLELSQANSDRPSRHVSKSRAKRFILRRIAKWIVVDRLLQMVVDDAVIRGDAEYMRTRVEIVPAKRKRWDRNLLLTYPHKSQESKKFALSPPKAHPYADH